MRRSIAWLVVVLACIAPLRSARSAMLGDASVAYSAQRTVTIDGRLYVGMVFHMPGLDRHEQQILGLSEVIILHADSKQGFLVLPEFNGYVAFPFPPLLARFDDRDLRRMPVAHETVNGIHTTKYRVDYVSADGGRARGFVWLSAQGVPMRLDGTVTPSGAARATAIRMELAGVKLGRQDPRLFELPAGFVQLPAAAFDAFFTGKRG